ncbi:MFS transporter [Loktanella sp. Alg231-35]|uniref:MFS transporter n=1 Tax=Loktanella sp. Alg231-35 TaxID=1922220 RepID=UPI000D54D597|nr:MFS transporter [Loktanella sp. Alg231-35]
MSSQIATANRNIALYPWFKLLQSLIFAQAVWFLYFQAKLSAAEAIMLYAIADLATTVLEVPSGYASDRFGRRVTLIIAGCCSTIGAGLLAVGDSFAIFAAGQIMMGAGGAFLSGTDSAFLYESLSAAGRADDVEAQEVKAWRFTFAALAMSAVTGGAVALYSFPLTFVLSAVALFAGIIISLRFVEPPRQDTAPQAGEVMRLGALGDALRNPVLIWLFALAVLMYGFSHIPFVFGQPFIQEALASVGLAQDAPMFSGLVTTVMMLLSVVASFFATRLRHRVGLVAILLLAFGMQITLSGVLALTNAPIVIAVLLLRMVPDALSKPFVTARIQPLLRDEARATYLSLQSLCGRVLFAATLFVASGATQSADTMPYADIQMVLGGYVAAGVIAITLLAFFARRLPIQE